MRRILTVIYLFIFTLLIALPASADLSRMGAIAYDSNSGLYWYSDLTYFVNMTYQQQIDAITNLSVPGYKGSWHLATLSEMEGLFSNPIEEVCNAFDPTSIYSGDYFVQYVRSGRYEYIPKPLYHDSSSFEKDFWYAKWPDDPPLVITYNMLLPWADQPDPGAVEWLGAFVASNDASPIPEPATMLLLGSGLLGLAGYGRKKFFKK